MSTEAAPAAVKRTLRVGVPVDHAFRLLTEKMGSWWPSTHHIAKTPFTEIVIEPRVGGRWFERDANGAQCDWGRVLVYEPPKRLVVSWHLQGDWSFDPSPARASEVVFEFFAEGL
ncbi:MAG TPA: SRPBCC domain-containing protein, partial [Candidatus Saccharimonadales bacterium]|nr:SRPBCC domain-containing protein [Candidatus Saccharimonadales bacterium]